MPSGNLIYKRGEIWWVELDPSTGVEAKKTRPCLILQNDLGNKQSSLTIVVPFLATRNYPFVVNIEPTSLNSLDRERGLHFSQIRVVDCSRVKSKIGTLEDDYWQKIVKAIAIQLQLQDFLKD